MKFPRQVLFAYLNLLKTISMKLTPGIVGLFFHDGDDNGSEASFPLYTEAVKFIAHRHALSSGSASTFELPRSWTTPHCGADQRPFLAVQGEL